LTVERDDGEKQDKADKGQEEDILMGSQSDGSHNGNIIPNFFKKKQKE
jgi:hypothetical protein